MDSYDIGARPLDPCFLPYAIVKNPRMVPTLIQSLKVYCNSLTQHAFPAHQAAHERIQWAKNGLATFRRSTLGMLSMDQLIDPVCSLLELLGHPTAAELSSAYVFVPGVVLSTAVKQPVTSASMLFVDDISRTKDGKDFCNTDEFDQEIIHDALNKMDRMADEKHVFNYEKSPYLRKHESLLIRVR
jgi:hypothetical protein